MRNNKMGVGIVLVAMIISLWGCDIINPAEPNPTTIHLNPFEFQVQPGQGSGNNRITEVWVFANGTNIGSFAPPVDIRYLEEGPTKLTFRPGIRNNGIANDAIIYPLFVGDSFDIVATQGSLHEIHPMTSYKPGTIFSLNSDFEVSNDFTFNRDTISASAVVRSQEDVFEGNFAGQITLSEDAYYIEVGNSVSMANLPLDDRPIYLEFRYKNDIEFAVGLLGLDLEGHEYSHFFFAAIPKEEWNMLYIDLTEEVKLSALPAYKILFRAIYPAGASHPEYHIFLDNIKVVHL